MTTAIENITPGGSLADPDLIPLIGMEDYDGSEFRIPRLSIIQTMEQIAEWGGQPGQFHSSMTGENLAVLDCVVLAVKKNRWLGPDFQESQAIRERGQEVTAYCKSSNGNVPDGDVVAPKCGSCRICPLGSPQKVEGGWEAATCTEIRKVLLALPDGSLSILTVRNKAAKEVDAFVQQFHARKQNFLTVRVTIGTKQEKGKLNTYYLPTFTVRQTEIVSPEDQRRYFDSIGFYAEQLKAQSADTHGEEVKEPVVGKDGVINTTATQVPPTVDRLADIPSEDEIDF